RVAPSAFGDWPHARRTVFIHPERVDSEDFAGREVNQPLQFFVLLQGLKQPRRAHVICFKRLPTRTAHAIDAHHGSSMHDHVGLLAQAAQLPAVFEQASLNRAHVRMFQQSGKSNRLVAEGQIEKKELVVWGELLGETRSDESRSTGNQNSLAANRSRSAGRGNLNLTLRTRA